MSLQYWKREKNFKAQDKGYVRDPEGFPFWFLLKRLKEEMKELEGEIRKYESLQPIERIANGIFIAPSVKVVKECADVSNFIDYIYSKATTNYPDKYTPTEDEGLCPFYAPILGEINNG